MLIYGSCALKYWYPSSRMPGDVDIISPVHDWIPSFEYIIDNNKHYQYVDTSFLYTIKVSHAAWDIHWDKTMHDIAFLKNQGCVLDIKLYKLLYDDWKIQHKNKLVKLDVTNSDFFKSNITRKYNHDWLHQQLCFYDRPLHESIRLDSTTPQCSKKLFDILSEDDKIRCAIEEIRVIGTERFLLNGEQSLLRARHKAIKLLITSMTTGWFNLFLIENIEVLMRYEVKTWQQQLKNILN